jgi:beta-lactam-binding protein with PASTA domain
LLLSTGIKLGHIAYEYTTDQTPGTILRQIPDAGTKVSVGESVDLWLVAIQDEEVSIPDTSILPEN